MKDANKEIINYPKKSFDYVILSQTLQTVERPKWILNEILRIEKVLLYLFLILAIGYAEHRFFKGKMPVTNDLKLAWYDTQNIHLCTIRDFNNLILN